MNTENNAQKWEIDIIDWEKVPLDAYKLCFEQGQKRLETIINDGEKITNRSYSIITLMIPVLTICLGIIINSIKKGFGSIEVIVSIIVIAVMCFCFYQLSKLILPRREFSNYIEPIEIVNSKRLEPTDLTEDEIIKSIYFNEMTNIQEKIDQNKITNQSRIKIFKKCLITMFLTTIILLTTILLIALF